MFKRWIKYISTWSLNAINRHWEEQRFIGERIYFKNLPYLLPIDKAELGRQSLQHHFFFSRNRVPMYSAPIDPHAKLFILDIGGGNGDWAEAMTKILPTAEVFNLNATIPLDDSDDYTYNRPANYYNLQQNFLKSIKLTDNYFDYVHMAFTGFAIPLYQWPHVIQEMVRLVKPGGWVEIVDFAPFEEVDIPTQFFNTIVRKVGRKHGIQVDTTIDVQKLLRQQHIVPVNYIIQPIAMSLAPHHPNSTLARCFVELLKTLCARATEEAILERSLIQLGFEHFYQAMLTNTYTVHLHTYYGQLALDH